MAFSTGAAVRIVALMAAIALPAESGAQPVERPPSFDIARIAGIRSAGENYAIQNPVRSDGLLRIYQLTTPYGDFTVRGDHLLRMRLNELGALWQLEKISGSQAFGKALAEAGLSPLKFTGQFIANPAKTMGDTLSGIGAVFGRISSGMANAGKAPGDPLAGLLGVSDQKRKLAVQFGVDPYTDFAPLDHRLSRLSEAAAAGGLTVSGALIAIPGAAGIVVSNLKTASSLEGIKIEDLARDHTAAQIFDLTRQRLAAMGADKGLIEGLLANRNYTPIDMAALVAALDSMPEVEDRTIFLIRAVRIDNRAIAYFMRRQAELLASHRRRAQGDRRLVRLVALAGSPFALTRGGQIVGVMPIDTLSWTTAASAALRDSAADARRISPGGVVELRITGTATARAKPQLKALGWRLVENIKF